MGNLTHYAGSGSGPLHTGLNNPGSPGETPDHAAAVADGYLSEDFVPGSSSSSRERKKGWITLSKKIRIKMCAFFLLLFYLTVGIACWIFFVVFCVLVD